SGGATGDDPADELQVGGHVVFDRAARAVAFELRPFVEADVGERVNHGLEIYFPPAEVIGVVLEVNFADPLATEPADLFDDVIAVLRGIADVVIGQHRGRFRPLHDADVFAGRDGVFEAED